MDWLGMRRLLHILNECRNLEIISIEFSATFNNQLLTYFLLGHKLGILEQTFLVHFSLNLFQNHLLPQNFLIQLTHIVIHMVKFSLLFLSQSMNPLTGFKMHILFPICIFRFIHQMGMWMIIGT